MGLKISKFQRNGYNDKWLDAMFYIVTLQCWHIDFQIFIFAFVIYYIYIYIYILMDFLFAVILVDIGIFRNSCIMN